MRHPDTFPPATADSTTTEPNGPDPMSDLSSLHHHRFHADRLVSRPAAAVNLPDRPRAAYGGETYLEATIATASPARLRLMLIERAVEISRSLADQWRRDRAAGSSGQTSGANERSLRLLEILSELLSGVTDSTVPVCRTVSDLYVFLCQHLIAAEATSDASAIDEIRLVLETEAETWRMVCVKLSGADTAARTEQLLATSAALVQEAGTATGRLSLEG